MSKSKIMNLIPCKLTRLNLMFAAKLSFECIPLASSSTLLAQLQIIELVNSVQPYTLKEAGYLLLVSNPRFVFSSD